MKEFNIFEMRLNGGWFFDDDYYYIELAKGNDKIVVNINQILDQNKISKVFEKSDLAPKEQELISYLIKEYYWSENLCMYLLYEYLEEDGFSKDFIWDTFNKLIKLNDDFSGVVGEEEEDKELLLYGNFITYFNLGEF